MINLDKLSSGNSELLCVVIHVIVYLSIYFQQLGYNLPSECFLLSVVRNSNGA